MRIIRTQYDRFFGGVDSSCLGPRKDTKTEDRTIVNHFHGVSSSEEVHRNVSGQTGRCTWKILELLQRPHARRRRKYTLVFLGTLTESVIPEL